MSEPTYEVVFGGELVEGAEKGQVIENLAALFKTSNEKITRLFSGGEVILKSNLDEPTAQRYQVTLHKAGAVCQVRPRQPVAKEASDSQNEIPSEAASQSAADPGQNEAAEPATAAETETPTSAPGEMTIDPPGVTIIEPTEKPELQVDTGAFSLAPVGSDVLEDKKKSPPPPPDTSELSLAPVGADILDKDS